MFLTVAKNYIELLRSDGFAILHSDGFAIRPHRISGFVIRNALQMRISNAGGFFRPFFTYSMILSSTTLFVGENRATSATH